jgi:hypothetical protein
MGAVEARLDALDDLVMQAVSLGLAHSAAQDDQLDGRVITVDGRRLVNFGSCSYLGLETHPELVAAVVDSVKRAADPMAVKAVWVAEPVRVHRLSDQEGQKLQRLVRRGTGSTVRLRRAMVVLASGGNMVPAIARLVQADEDSVRQAIHRFNDMGMPRLDPNAPYREPGGIAS